MTRGAAGSESGETVAGRSTGELGKEVVLAASCWSARGVMLERPGDAAARAGRVGWGGGWLMEVGTRTRWYMRVRSGTGSR